MAYTYPYVARVSETGHLGDRVRALSDALFSRNAVLSHSLSLSLCHAQPCLTIIPVSLTVLRDRFCFSGPESELSPRELPRCPTLHTCSSKQICTLQLSTSACISSQPISNIEQTKNQVELDFWYFHVPKIRVIQAVQKQTIRLQSPAGRVGYASGPIQIHKCWGWPTHI